MTARGADELLAVSLAEILCRCVGEDGLTRLVVPDSPAEVVEDGLQDGPEAALEPEPEPDAESSPGPETEPGAEHAIGLPSKRRRIAPAGFHSALRWVGVA